MPGSIQVLHVDDEPGFAELTAAYLERENDRIEVVTEPSARAGLDALGSRDVDCIVSDHDLPEMDGVEFLEAVREDDAELPFILFTGRGSEEVASRAISAGVTDYLQKGSGTDHYALLANRIENAVERRRSQRAVERQKRRLETLVSNLPGMVYRCRTEPGWPMEDVEGECERLTGYASSALEDGDVSWGADVIHPADREAVRAEVLDALSDGDAFQCTYRIRTADGDVKRVWERGRGVDASGDAGTLRGSSWTSRSPGDASGASRRSSTIRTSSSGCWTPRAPR
ncbi:response regulator [Haloplanus sp. GCM10025708]|uniref:response regulator n=1 Tax=Haloplanus sp. GCM10025708 TaxID=3252679 RepID=UPI00361AA00B